MRSFSLHVALLTLALSVACAKPTPAPLAPAQPEAQSETPAPANPQLSAEDIYASVAFLADDAQGGRPPGGEDDAAVQAWIIERMQAAGLQPGAEAGQAFVQHFEVGDGVALRDGQSSRLAERGAKPDAPGLAHALLPFGHDSGEAGVEGKLVFVGEGVAGEGEDAGDYAGIEAKVKGAIVVALVGSKNPHANPARSRPQGKLIAARDRGAVGFVLWDPNSDAPLPNHGQFSELEVPAVFVGKSGSAALRQALRARGEAPPKLGATSRKAFGLSTPIEPVILETANVIGVLPGSDPEAERKRIYVGAHMDHLGMGTSSSLTPGVHAIHNGADDNASGVAVILALAEAMAAIPPAQRPHDLVFVAFGAEEMGLLGSKFMVENFDAAERARIMAMLNFDMVGRLRERLMVNGQGSAEEWPALVQAANGGGEGAAEGADVEALVLEGDPSGWGASDHASFYGEGVPVLHFFTGSHDDYHKPSDDLDTLNTEGTARVGELAGRVLVGLMQRCDPLTFVEVERPSAGRRAFKVSLGSMPDYGRDVDGLALAGVREGGPMALAGLQKGDVITRIGAREVHNIDDYMACFGELEPGVEVEIEYLRDGERMTGALVPTAPSPH
ncbi:M20/M25/M40 family metallo-hydrolase [Pseudenhygromyxa sp. WMMC2535]|uniref:M28 family peptidase n=1 Tax=Pseudenhygromyxa sp. WMMC2535 TaxID=2712867 RepID=UPI001556CB24|nr:M28 family peptidase [Pseudenhygromyxa sp. WMMC2535]NVB40052.1 M20/M25/M40 family metallo-hydrolase [Pseudenhygromyxa sp. WMMC2535]